MPSFADMTMTNLTHSSQVFADRRRRFMQSIGPGSVAVIAGRSASQRNSDVENRFRQPSDLIYLTGFHEPESWVVLAPAKDKPFCMFVRPRDPERETWTGRRAGLEGAKARYGADQSFPIDKLREELPKLLDGAEKIYFVPGEDRGVDEIVNGALASLRGGERRGMHAPNTICDLRTCLHEQRLIKDEAALAVYECAAAVTAEAHIAAMRAAGGPDGKMEYEIEALVDYTFRRRGGCPGYGTIVGGGDNATILHYVDCTDPLREGELLLIDAGCELEGFTADVTRTFPIRSRFSPAQKRLYELVLHTEVACIQAVEPGATIDGIHALAVEMLTAGMVELGLLRGEPAALISSGAYKRFYMHRTSHWLGLDVHDVGAYTVDGKPRPLQEGMLLTVEPGIYIPKTCDDVPAEYRGIGIRIEDDILVTASGNRILTAAVPKEVSDIEALTAG